MSDAPQASRMQAMAKAAAQVQSPRVRLQGSAARCHDVELQAIMSHAVGSPAATSPLAAAGSPR